ncbi:hypothetical protein [Paracoccus sp. (in: a-proteobacteria)]|uniref:hypothetical protein n=1 Tax=Paracoccus sp. TaxID=267 RepID=UPI00396C6B14
MSSKMMVALNRSHAMTPTGSRDERDMLIRIMARNLAQDIAGFLHREQDTYHQ